MFKGNVLLTFLFFALLLAAIYLAKPPWLGWKRENKRLFADFAKEKVSEIRVKRDRQAQTRLIKEGEKWLVAHLDNFVADEELVEKALAAVIDAEIEEVASLRKEKWPEFEVSEDKGLRVELVESGDDAIVQFWVGKTGRDYQSSYVRKSGDEKVYLLAGNLGSLFGTKEWREMRVMGKMGEIGEIKGLKFKDRDGQLVLEKIGEEWMMRQPLATAAAKNRVEFVLDELKRLRAVEATRSAKLANFQSPEIELTMMNEGGEKRLLIDGKDESGKNRYAKLKEGEIIYLITQADAGTFERTVADFLNPTGE